MKIKVKYRDNMPEIEKHGDLFDLATSETVTIAAGNVKLIDLGVAIELPEGCYAKVYPRSSTPLKWHVMMANSVGIIDHDYCGDEDWWKFPAYAIDSVTIPKHTRIAQFEICKADNADIEIEKVASLSAKNRGGFGSTGE